MAVKVRLAKTGKKHRISYRIVAQDAHSKRDSAFLEILGYYLPYETNAKSLNLKVERIKYWLSKGAKPTSAVNKLIIKQIENIDGKST